MHGTCTFFQINVRNFLNTYISGFCSCTSFQLISYISMICHLVYKRDMGSKTEIRFRFFQKLDTLLSKISYLKSYLHSLLDFICLQTLDKNLSLVSLSTLSPYIFVHHFCSYNTLSYSQFQNQTNYILLSHKMLSSLTRQKQLSRGVL